MESKLVSGQRCAYYLYLLVLFLFLWLICLIARTISYLQLEGVVGDLKNEGTRLYRSKRYDLSAGIYSLAISLSGDTDSAGDTDRIESDLLADLFRLRATCYFALVSHFPSFLPEFRNMLYACCTR